MGPITQQNCLQQMCAWINLFACLTFHIWHLHLQSDITLILTIGNLCYRRLFLKAHEGNESSSEWKKLRDGWGKKWKPIITFLSTPSSFSSFFFLIPPHVSPFIAHPRRARFLVGNGKECCSLTVGFCLCVFCSGCLAFSTVRIFV